MVHGFDRYAHQGAGLKKDEQVRADIGEDMLPFETPEVPDEDDIDPFAELEVDSTPPAERGSDLLDSFVDEKVTEQIVNSPDVLSAFEDDDEDIIDFEDESAPEPNQASPATSNSAEATYRLLLETVWVDDILDPSEVELLARKRVELGITFERHLKLVRDIIGG